MQIIESSRSPQEEGQRPENKKDRHNREVGKLKKKKIEIEREIKIMEKTNIQRELQQYFSKDKKKRNLIFRLLHYRSSFGKVCVSCKVTRIPTQYLHTYFTRSSQGEKHTQYLHTDCTECYIQIYIIYLTCYIASLYPEFYPISISYLYPISYLSRYSLFQVAPRILYSRSRKNEAIYIVYFEKRKNDFRVQNTS